jgi:hypothetical protein
MGRCFDVTVCAQQTRTGEVHMPVSTEQRVVELNLKGITTQRAHLDKALKLDVEVKVGPRPLFALVVAVNAERPPT